MFLTRRVAIACKCSRSHIFPEDSDVLDSNYLDPNDWWIKEKCKYCGTIGVIGGPVVVGQLLHGEWGMPIMEPHYL